MNCFGLNFKFIQILNGSNRLSFYPASFIIQFQRTTKKNHFAEIFLSIYSIRPMSDSSMICFPFKIEISFFFFQNWIWYRLNDLQLVNWNWNGQRTISFCFECQDFFLVFLSVIHIPWRVHFGGIKLLFTLTFYLTNTQTLNQKMRKVVEK